MAAMRSVWFDCDSTLSAVEGIDELAARFRPHLADRIAGLTAAAMSGALPLDEVYARRLDSIAPTRDEVAAIGELYVARRVADAAEVIAALRRAGVEVGIVSGGLLPAVAHLATALGVAPERVHAVDVYFHDDGAYRGFDRGSPLARSGGKRDVLAAVAEDLRPCAMVGDGVTDLEAAPVVDLFVGFGGVVRRPAVADAGTPFVPGPGLRDLLSLVFEPA